MLEKLYEQGYLNYQTLILNNYKKLEINEVDAIVLIKILDLCKTNKKLRISKLTQETNMTKKQVEESLNNLIVRNIYGIDVVVNDAGLNDERVSLTPLFDKLEAFFKEESVIKMQDGIKQVIGVYENEINRPITPQEYSIFEDFIIKDGFSVNDILESIKQAVKMNRLTLSQIEKDLISKRKAFLTPSEPLEKEKKKVLDEIFNML